MTDDRGAEAVPVVQWLTASILRLAAVFIVCVGVVTSLGLWLIWSRADDWSLSLYTGLVLQLLYAATLAIWGALLWRRAAVIGALGARDYPVIGCVVVLMRLAGESFALALVAGAAGMAVLALSGEFTTIPWIAPDLLAAGPIAAAGLRLVAALVFAAAGVFAGGAVLFGAYLAAEVLTVMIEYARDVRRIREALVYRGTVAAGDG